MIPRRARIKVAAKIPIRRKIETPLENGEKTENFELDHNTCNSVEEVLNSVEIKKQVQENVTDISENVNSNNDAPIIPYTENDIDLKIDGSVDKITVNDSTIQPNIVPESKPITRRWIPKPKPLVRLGAAIRRPKPIPNLNSSKEPTVDSLKNQNIENEKPPNVIPQEKGVPEVLVQVEPVIEAQNVVDTKISNNIGQSPIKSGSDSEKNTANPLSTSKLINRARIRPVPKFIRRNSIQGSASESEDDSRRTHSRIRTDSVCSTTSVTTEQTMNKDGISTPKEKNISTKVQKFTRKSDQTRKVAEARKEFYTKFGSNKPDKKRLTMMDLIYYNPVSNPMPQNRKQSLSESAVTTIESKIPDEEEIEDDPDETKYADMNPVPQVKVGPNGEIILDEQSLVIEQTGMKKGREQIANSKIIDGDDQNRAYGIYKRPKRAKEWSALETLRFYRSLNTLGTDFSMMVSLFPGRTRRDLKVKFKKEERLNQHLIDKALTNPNEFYLEDLEEQARKEQEIINRKLEKEIILKKVMINDANSQKPSKTKKRIPSKFARQMDDIMCTSKKRKAKKKRDLYSVLEKGMTNALDSDSESDEEFVPKYKIIKLNPPITRLPRLTKSQTEPIDDITSEEEQEEDDDEASVITNDEDNNNDAKDVTADVETVVRNEETVENIKDRHESSPEEIHLEDELPSLEKEVDIQQPPSEEINGGTNEILEEIDAQENTDTNEEKKTSQESEGLTIPNILPNNMSTVEPGSLMILSSVGPDGRPIYKVFMVTPNQNKLPVNLSQDVVQSLANSLGQSETVSLDLPVVDETSE